ncbi:CRISPR-associated helicase Cas3' [Kribbella sp. NPDC059898]|uniref:CRISPR-associated helicase Cas3' n=1 Tax=Kribbella sp. NPDC059898 TaxID=3346995 RepID=UPI003647C47E
MPRTSSHGTEGHVSPGGAATAASTAELERGLSTAARSVWAKSPGRSGAWLPLWQHMDDSAAVARALVDDWLAPAVVRLLAEDFHGDEAGARSTVVFLAGVHDLGKATPAFAVQNEPLAQLMRDQGLAIPRVLPDRELAPHSVAGQHLLTSWLTSRGWTVQAARTWGVVIGGHHGVPPDVMSEDRAACCRVPDLYGGSPWDQVREDLLHRASAQVRRARLLDGPGRRLSQRFQVIATGIVIVSDWIASNSALFGFPAGRLPETGRCPQRVAAAMEKLGLPKPWSPAPAELSTDRIFTTRFALPVGASARPVQRAAYEVANVMSEPGMLVIEAAMGEGKTEAALAAAEVLARRFGAGGLLVALPTQATTDAMFGRVVDWLDRLGSSDQTVSGAISLVHGRSRFNRTYQGLPVAGLAEVGIDEQPGCGMNGVVAHTWLSGRKKAQLANFSIATIDQLLFAGLKARHLMLRHLGLAGKVVVIDEVHAYDAYMNSYLTTVLRWLGAYRVPVIALSATLPGERRTELIAAYAEGQAEGQAMPEQVGARGATPRSRSVPAEVGYPALTWLDGRRLRRRVPEGSGRSSSVEVQALPDGGAALVRLLKEALVDGGTAVVVHNTVRRVLASAAALEAVFPGEVLVAHARFTAADRLRIDRELLDAFGSPARALERPFRRIVVASQVVEQSLDVDFDLMVTDLAPIDLVLQRLGRLHRHERGTGQTERPQRLRTARVYITGADFEQNPPCLDRGSVLVYEAHPLLRAAAVLLPRLGSTIELPADIAPFVQAAYGSSQVGPLSWQEALVEAEAAAAHRRRRRERAAATFRISPPQGARPIAGWVTAGLGEVDDTAQGRGQVRDGEPSVETVLVQSDVRGAWSTPAWFGDPIGGVPVPRDTPPTAEVAEAMAASTLRLPLSLSTPAAESELRQATPAAWRHCPAIAHLPALVVTADGEGHLAGRRIRYTPEKGLEVFDDHP